ncbi:MAG: hypothetical protein H0W81_06785 [Chloroflexi bacterium]|nr:hypothetical protein [Chloroflexota bacterium]
MGLIVSLGIGLALGYLTLSLGQVGGLTMIPLLALLTIYYLRGRRVASASALAIGAGSMAALVLGSVVVSTLTDPAVHTEALTYIGFIVALVVLGYGLMLGMVALSRRT